MNEFGLRFILSNLFLTVIIAAILAVKKLFQRHMSASRQYQLWFLFLLLLVLPFLPAKNTGFSVYSLISGHKTAKIGNFTAPGTVTVQNGDALLLGDYALPVKQSDVFRPGSILVILWVLGMGVMCWYTLRSNVRLYRRLSAALPIQNVQVRGIYRQCVRESRMKREIPLFSSAFLRSPISAGFFHPRIILPIHLLSHADKNDIRYILLHELQHLKRKDLGMNLVLCLVQIVYWFHPAVWYALRRMRDDRELACDSQVLQILDEGSRREYGMTLLKFAGSFSEEAFTAATGMGGPKRQLEKRILGILSYRRESPVSKVKSILVLLLTGIMVLSSAPVLSAGASPEPYPVPSSKVSNLEADSYFQGYQGSFVLYDMSEDRWDIYNKEGAAARYSPDSTYKIYTALFALESGIITPQSSGLSWDGSAYPFESWNRDQDLDSAMKNSVNWYFQKLDAELCADNVGRYLKQISYGNQDISGGMTQYWLESSLKISPAEQVELLVDFYKNNFKFSQKSIQAVKDSIFITAEDGYRLYGKTGTGNIEGENKNGWFIGYAETDNNTYFFAANLQADSNADGSHAAQISLDILKSLDILS